MTDRSTTSFWDHVARLPGFSAVTDYQPTETPWARYVTALHLRALHKELRLARDARVLDFGCGVGRISDWLAPRVAEVIGVDSSSEMIAAATRRCLHRNVHLHHLQGDPRALPWRDLDAAVAVWVLQHIPDAELFDATVGLLAAAVRPGGDVVTLDRLCRERVEQSGSDYLCLRGRAEYAAAFAHRGLRLVAVYPVSINEQVLGSPTLTRLQRRHGWLRSLAVTADLAWARRQPDPFVADHLWHFRR